MLPLIATHEMSLLPRLRLRLDILSNDMIHRHLKLDVLFNIQRAVHVH
jgi:hypothetical protein